MSSRRTDLQPTLAGGSALRRPFWTRHLRRDVQFLLDLAVLATAFVLAYLLRFDFAVPPGEVGRAIAQLPMVVLVQLAAMAFFGIYSFVWRYIGMAEIRSFVLAAFMSGAPLVALRLFLPSSLQTWRIPLSVIFINTVLAFLGVLGLRVM